LDNNDNSYIENDKSYDKGLNDNNKDGKIGNDAKITKKVKKKDKDGQKDKIKKKKSIKSPEKNKKPIIKKLSSKVTLGENDTTGISGEQNKETPLENGDINLDFIEEQPDILDTEKDEKMRKEKNEVKIKLEDKKAHLKKSESLKGFRNYFSEEPESGDDINSVMQLPGFPSQPNTFSTINLSIDGIIN